MSELTRGVYRVIEGPEGAGKTTQKDILNERLRSIGRTVIDIREPGGTPIGEALRPIIKDSSLERSPRTNLDLFTICRREIAEQIIRPNIIQGKDISTDRNWWSTYAIQGYAEGVELEDILNTMERALGDQMHPDYGVIIDLPVEVSMVRILRRDDVAADYFDRKDAKFFKKVRTGYLALAEMYDIPVVNGNRSVERVHEDIWRHMGAAALEQ